VTTESTTTMILSSIVRSRSSWWCNGGGERRLRGVVKYSTQILQNHMSSIHQCENNVTQTMKYSRNRLRIQHHSSSSRRRLVSSSNHSCRSASFRFSDLSSRQSAELEDELLNRLNNISINIISSSNNLDQRLIDPIIGKSLTRNGLDWIRSISIPSSFDKGEENVITVNLQPPTMLHPKLQEISSNITQVVQEEMVKLLLSKKQYTLQPQDIEVSVRITPQHQTTTSNNSNTSTTRLGETTPQSSSFALKNITHFLAVYSCKGGVGKSTIAANLAYQLSAMGGRVGLLDLDVYGPSLPLLVQPDDPTVRKSPPHIQEGMVEPIVHKGVKLMSLGFVSPNSGVPGSGPNGGAAVLRGPMAGRVVSQLLKGTNWGELDVLVLDMPPGTGDVQLEVCQSLSLSGAVAVSTPSALSWADVRKVSILLPCLLV
jgi:Mrp family chromosome partitioning ATPase